MFPMRVGFESTEYTEHTETFSRVPRLNAEGIYSGKDIISANCRLRQFASVYSVYSVDSKPTLMGNIAFVIKC